jgi:PTH1 family peptidyl-tRNA hydrolase
MSVTHLLIGLGNPEPEYAGTRHNIGFMAVDAIAGHLRCPVWKKKFSGLVTAPPDHDALLLKPLTYMNLSGESAGAAMRFHKLAPDNVIVFHDDLDLQPGQVKIKQGGGAAGHNGLKSLDAHIGPDYWRVRLGIGHPGVKGDEVTNYVLSPFAKSDRAWREPLLEALASNIALLLEDNPAEYLARLPRGEAV